MPYAAVSDIEARHPGALASVGPVVDGVLNEAAVGLALTAADEMIDAHLAVAGWAVPLAAPIPGWVVDVAVPLALYLAAPPAIAGHADFQDLRRRYDAALLRLQNIARGELLPHRPEGGMPGVYASSAERRFGRGAL